MDSTIMVLMIGSITGILGLCLKLSYSSHCTRIKCFCVEITRDVNTETRINLGEILPPQNNMV
jgi:hypothetical protein